MLAAAAPVDSGRAGVVVPLPPAPPEEAAGAGLEAVPTTGTLAVPAEGTTEVTTDGTTTATELATTGTELATTGTVATVETTDALLVQKVSMMQRCS